MKSAIFFSTLIPVISAHTRFTTLFVNSQSQGDGTCIRMDMDPNTTDNFVASVTSSDMACGVSGDTPVARTCPLKAGDSISLEHRVWTDGSKPELSAIDPSHKGPTAIYMKKLADPGSSDPYSTPASGDGWFKIAYTGYENGKWGTEIMNANNARVDATVPSDLPGGYYLIRSEVLALQFHNGDTVQPQFYAGCAQVYVDSSKSGDVSAKTVSIPGYVQADSPSLNYDIYKGTPDTIPYPEFGPTLYGSTSARARDTGHLAARSPRFRVDGFRHSVWTNVAYESNDSGSDSENSTDNTKIAIDASSTTPTASTTTSVKSDVTARTSSASASASKPTPQSQSTSGSSSSSSSNLSIVGLCPSDTVLMVANKCLEEIPSWSGDTAGPLPKCWAASKQCWDISSHCWDNISPAVNTNDMNTGCHAWENKCNALDDWCHAGNLEGPPAWSGGNVKTSRMGKRDVARHVVAARRRGLRR